MKILSIDSKYAVVAAIVGIVFISILVSAAVVGKIYSMAGLEVQLPPVCKQYNNTRVMEVCSVVAGLLTAAGL